MNKPEWMQAIRREPAYLSYETWEYLQLIAKAKSVSPETDTGGRIVTPDMVANEMLLVAIKEKYPQLSKYRYQVGKIKDELLKTLS